MNIAQGTKIERRSVPIEPFSDSVCREATREEPIERCAYEIAVRLPYDGLVFHEILISTKYV